MAENKPVTVAEQVTEIVEWLKQYREKAGSDGFVLGLSGGIDSAVVAHLIMLACPQNSLGVIMPAGNLAVDAEDGILSAAAARIPYITLDLTTERQQLTDRVDTALAKEGLMMNNERMVRGNIGARLRMTTLYAVGNSLNYLVVGTDNLDESYLGYFTKYGDGGVDILPLAHLTKGEVFAMGEYLGVPQSIIEKKPSAGFFHAQTDEAEMGVDYKTIDAFLRGEGIDGEKRKIIDKLHKNSEHKRKMPPSVR